MRTPWLMTVLALGMVGVGGQALFAEGHGPTFTLATPTLADNAWSSDTVAMALSTEDDTAFMFRQMIGYGITEDLQLSLSFSLSQPISRLKPPPRTRLGVMMGAFGDLEGSLLWRFHRRAPDIGSRFESAAFFATSLPLEDGRGGVEVGPGITAGAVTGYASRTIYWWIGGGDQVYFREGGDRLGNLAFVSAVVGWRPPVFQHDYPKPDWRIFLESLAEFAGRNVINGRNDPNSGGEKVLIGPSLLGLYGQWGVEVGVLVPVFQESNGNPPEEEFRTKLVFTYWF